MSRRPATHKAPLGSELCSSNNNEAIDGVYIPLGEHPVVRKLGRKVGASISAPDDKY